MREPAFGEDRGIATGNVPQVHLVEGIVFIADADGRLFYVFEATVLHKEFFVVVGVDVDNDRNLPGLQADQHETCLPGADGGATLAFEPGVDDGAGPARTWFRCKDAIV